MKHTSEELEHYSYDQSQEPEMETTPKKYRLRDRILAIILAVVVIFAFAGTCYWLAMYGRA